MLNRSDIVDIIAPSGTCDVGTLEKSINFVNSLGLIARTKSDLLGSDLHCSNNLDYRFEHLKEALYANDSKAIWCLRGGYGSAQLFDKLNLLKKPNNKKLFIGFSDITFLHIFLNQKWNWQTIHGSVLTQFANNIVNQQTINRTTNLLFGIEKNITFDNLIKLNKSVSSDNEIKAKICGGNLTLIQNSIGTNWQINCENKFLFLEEINENPYKIDRLLLHLKQANIFKNCKAILLGDFLPDHKNDKLQKTLKMFSENINIPVFKIKDIGHGPSNYPLPFNYDAILNFKKASLSVKIH